ncbi:hypothetical protein [Corynebacterium minutissimum]|uniref:Uncharacterized protein n=1 Tax=Corynebacterium minutissimum TaxID=38301 RepID=A0A376CYA2_9CORY|nr:hypothetical protein [Corynebacterium minutissimum]QRP60855.1 hypothetical protein I6J26_12025 [Corynebacterium minutissimum]STC77442.1 Uncharacterised protein [Corynebacterium minutissimum]
MSDIERYEPSDSEISAVKNEFRNTAVDAIDRELEVIQKASEVVPVLIRGRMVPQAYLPDFSPRKNAPAQGEDAAIAKALAAAVYGANLGFGVSTSLQNVFVVNGTPSIYARTAVSLVLAQGHEVWVDESSAERVVVCGRRRGSSAVFTSTWDIKRAKKAGFTSNQKYASQPEEMLYAKAAMEVCRRMAADVLNAIPYSSEELELEGPAPIKAQARRMDSGRGNAGLKAALANSTSHVSEESAAESAEPAQLEAQPAPAEELSDDDAALLADLKETLNGYTGKADVEKLMADLQKEGAPDAFLQAGRDRWREIDKGNAQ